MVTIGKWVYFAPNCKFANLDFDDKNGLIRNFKKRIDRYYLSSIDKLNSMYSFYCAGLICVSLIDALARIAYGGGIKSRFKRWVKTYLGTQHDSFNDEEIIDSFYENFRNGLVHEARVKNCGQFTPKPISVVDILDSNGYKILIVNPKKLVGLIRKGFNEYIDTLRRDDEAYNQFRENMLHDIKDDVELAKS